LTSVFLTDIYTTTVTISTSLVLYLYMDIRKIKWLNWIDLKAAHIKQSVFKAGEHPRIIFQEKKNWRFDVESKGALEAHNTACMKTLQK